MAANFSNTILEAGRKVNPEFEVIMEMGWQYTEDEFESILQQTPKGVTFSHSFGGTLMTVSPVTATQSVIQKDAKAGLDPYLDLEVSGGFDAEPVFGVPAPGLLIQKFQEISRLNPRRLFTYGGSFSSPQCPYNINQELYAELIRNGSTDPEQFLLMIARHWCDGDNESADLLVEAWKTGDQAIRTWPNLNWYTAGIGGPTQGRWLTKPLVPDITRLSKRERVAWERKVFPLPDDIGRLNILFEAGVRRYDDEQFERAVQGFDTQMFPQLEKTLDILNRALAIGKKPVIEDQRDRYRGVLLLFRSERNSFQAQVATNSYLLKKGNPAAAKGQLRSAIQAEIANTQEWIHALTTSKTNWFHLAIQEETPFLYKTPVEDLTLKLEAMHAHLNDEPGPYLKQLTEPKPTFLYE